MLAALAGVDARAARAVAQHPEERVRSAPVTSGLGQRLREDAAASCPAAGGSSRLAPSAVAVLTAIGRRRRAREQHLAGIAPPWRHYAAMDDVELAGLASRIGVRAIAVVIAADPDPAAARELGGLLHPADLPLLVRELDSMDPVDASADVAAVLGASLPPWLSSRARERHLPLRVGRRILAGAAGRQSPEIVQSIRAVDRLADRPRPRVLTARTEGEDAAADTDRIVATTGRPAIVQFAVRCLEAWAAPAAGFPAPRGGRP